METVIQLTIAIFMGAIVISQVFYMKKKYDILMKKIYNSLDEILSDCKVETTEKYFVRLNKEIECDDMVLIKLKNRINSSTIRLNKLLEKDSSDEASIKSLELLKIQLFSVIEKYNNLVKMRNDKLNNYSENILRK